MRIFIDEEAREEYISYQMYRGENESIKKYHNDYHNDNNQKENKTKK